MQLHKQNNYCNPVERPIATTLKTSPDDNNNSDLLKCIITSLGPDGLRWFGFCARSRAIIILLNSVTRYTITRRGEIKHVHGYQQQ